MELLKNKKTFLCAIGVGVVATLHALGVLDQGTADLLQSLLGAGGLAALRQAVK